MNNMKEFKSTNDIDMVEGVLFNWQKEYLFDEKTLRNYSFGCGTWGSYYDCSYYPDKQILYMSMVSMDDHDTFSFKCTMEEAEKIIIAFMEAHDFEIGKLYEK